MSEKIPVLDEQRCVYCHQQALFYYEQQPYCSSQCQDKYELEMKSIRKNLKWFYLGIVIGVLISLVSAFNSHPGIQSKGVGVGMMILGGTILLYPYCTPETYDLFGLKKTQLMGRVVGAITELIGLFFLI